MKPARFDPDAPHLRDKDDRKGEFGKCASDIVKMDRLKKKRFINYDTGGEIVRAMEHAYQLGLKHRAAPMLPTSKKAKDNQPVPWNSIPVKSREALRSIIEHEWVPFWVPGAEPRRRNGAKWVCYMYDETKPENQRSVIARSYGPATIVPLINMGLAREDKTESHTVLMPTKKGVESYMAHKED